MFGWNMEFRVVTRHVDALAKNVAMVLRSFGVEIMDMREADIVANADGSKHGDVYILCCKGPKVAYQKFMKEYSLTEIMYEGVKTLM